MFEFSLLTPFYRSCWSDFIRDRQYWLLSHDLIVFIPFAVS
jgi:hypothetical protein